MSNSSKTPTNNRQSLNKLKSVIEDAEESSSGESLSSDEDEVIKEEPMVKTFQDEAIRLNYSKQIQRLDTEKDLMKDSFA